MRGVRRLSQWCLAVLCAASGSCADGGSPSGIIIFESGNQQSDTAYAELTQPLRVRVFGAPSGTIVRFQSLLADTGLPRSSVYVGAAFGGGFYDGVADSTDQTGEASARIKLGTVAGQGRLQVSVPELNLVDTATFTILPGRAARVVAMPADTTLYAAGTFQGRAVATDQWGNVRADDPVVYTDGSTGITVSATGLVTAATIGRSSYVARAGTSLDTAYVSVVPRGTIVAVRLSDAFAISAIVMVELDGAGLTVLTPVTIGSLEDPNPRWSPDGSRIVYSAIDGQTSRLFTVTPAGTVSRVITSPPPELFAEVFPHFTRDGSFIYFGGRLSTTNYQNWRVAATGTGAARIAPDSNSGGIEIRAAPSADGQRLAYQAYSYAVSGAIVKIKYFVGDTISTWFVRGTTPRWDPVGERFAFGHQLGGAISLVNSDGTNVHEITPPGRAYGESGYDWSPDGQWIIARGPDMLELINVASGQTLPLAYSTNLVQPTWRP